MRRGWRRLGPAAALALVVSGLAAQAAYAAWNVFVEAPGGALATYVVPPPAQLRCTGLATLSTSRIVWDAVSGPAGASVSYRVTTPAGVTTITTATSTPLPAISLLAGAYRIETVISSGWRSSPSSITVTLNVLGLLYLCGS